MNLALYDYDLPPERIALHPAAPRDAARLLVMRRGAAVLAHRRFTDLTEYLRPGDTLVVNDTRVIPARLHARRVPGGGKVEILLLRPERPGTWEVLWRPRRRTHAGMRAEAGGSAGAPELAIEVTGESASGHVLARFESRTGEPLDALLERLGEPPIPPYIKRPAVPEDRIRYQTVFARERGSVAAPTAGLHFTEELLDRVRAAGVRVAPVTLHVGLATFQPVSERDLAAGELGEERVEVPEETARLVNESRARGGRVIAVGTTSVRALESAWEGGPGSTDVAGAAAGGKLRPFHGTTRLFIRPPYTFRAVDAMVTNFHLPRSSLLLLTAAFAGREPLLDAYQTALRDGYRFASYGDAMLVLERAAPGPP